MHNFYAKSTKDATFALPILQIYELRHALVIYLSQLEQHCNLFSLVSVGPGAMWRREPHLHTHTYIYI